MRTEERMGTTVGAGAAAVPCAVFYLEVRWEDWENLTLPPRLLPEPRPPPLTPERTPEPEHPHDSTLGESSREAQSGRRLLGTNG